MFNSWHWKGPLIFSIFVKGCQRWPDHMRKPSEILLVATALSLWVDFHTHWCPSTHGDEAISGAPGHEGRSARGGNSPKLPRPGLEETETRSHVPSKYLRSDVMGRVWGAGTWGTNCLLPFRLPSTRSGVQPTETRAARLETGQRRRESQTPEVWESASLKDPYKDVHLFSFWIHQTP